jgi:TonB family protein
MRHLKFTLRSNFCWLAAMAIPLGYLLAQGSPSAIVGVGPNVPPCSIAHPEQYPEHMVSPKYPKQALASGVQGSVELTALVDRYSRTRDLRVIKGDPVLVSSAMKAVREWRFRPMLVEGVPVETTYGIKIRFDLLLQEAISEVEVESPHETAVVHNSAQSEAGPPEGEVY